MTSDSRLFTMTELLLTFTDENGANNQVFVNQEVFTVGRHSANDLSIADSRLSREHLKIERFNDIFVATDLGSSNGTSINGKRLENPTSLKNNDSLNLGGLELKVALDNGNFAGNSNSSFDNDDFAEEKPSEAEAKKAETTAPSPKPPISPSSNVPANSGSIPKSFYIIAPLFGFIVLLVIGLSFYLFSEKKEPEIASNSGNFIYSSDDENENTEPKNSSEENTKTDKTPTDSPTPVKNQTDSNSTNKTNSSENSFVPTPTPANLSETAKIEQNSASFLRIIAQNDPKAFLSSDQAKIVGGKTKQFGNSSALADNIKSARANASQIQALANSKNLRPQFLACVAITRLGNARGNVLQTAQSMVENLDKLLIHVGGERADDALLMVAAYDRSASGSVIEFRNMLQQLSNQFPESSRTIRTIWFLKQKGKISDAEFDFALRFLAIGTITQNPKEFAVNAEELKLN
jgi:pSer/pThr/pTyr-binding forkhead associated (FHA) protein